jgi:hypothetical protein
MLTELLQEAGFIHKFDQLEGQLRRADIAQLKEILRDDYAVNLQLDQVDSLPPMHCGGAAMDHHKIKGLYGMKLEVGRGVDDGTKVSTVQGLIDNIRHELMHIKHVSDVGVDHEDYKMPVSNDPKSTVAYTYQYMERAPQALDLCTALAATDSNPDEFMQAVNRTVEKVDIEQDHAHEIETISRHAMLDVHGHNTIHGHIGSENERYLYVVHHHVTTMAMAKIMLKQMEAGKDKTHLKNMLGSFQKQVRNKFSEARAYFRKHSGDRHQSFKTTQARIDELDTAQTQFVSGLSALMGKKRSAA